jgi:hypothetical protein
LQRSIFSPFGSDGKCAARGLDKQEYLLLLTRFGIDIDKHVPAVFRLAPELVAELFVKVIGGDNGKLRAFYFQLRRNFFLRTKL